MLAIEIPQYTYSTGAVARNTAYALDLHYGSHNKKSMFGCEKNGPGIALVGAIGSISAGAAAMGAATTAMGSILGGMMIAGGIASGLGAITGNKTLSTLGMGLGLVGGIGAGLTNAATGEFMNPFSEGFKFSETAMGEGFSKIKSFFSDVGAPATQDAAAALSSGADDALNAAKTSGIDSATGTLTSGGTEQLKYIDGVPQTLGAKVSDAVGSATSGGGGLLSSLGGVKDIMALGVGLSDGYKEGQKIEQQQPLFDAKTDQINAETQLAQSRYNNMQAQPGVNIGVNDNASIYKQNNSTGKVAVIVDGKVQYMTPEQYAQIMQAQQQQTPQNQTGLLGAA